MESNRGMKIIRQPSVPKFDMPDVVICENIRDEYHAALLVRLLNQIYVGDERQSWDKHAVYRAVPDGYEVE